MWTLVRKSKLNMLTSQVATLSRENRALLVSEGSARKEASQLRKTVRDSFGIALELRAISGELAVAIRLARRQVLRSTLEGQSAGITSGHVTSYLNQLRSIWRLTTSLKHKTLDALISDGTRPLPVSSYLLKMLEDDRKVQLSVRSRVQDLKV